MRADRLWKGMVLVVLAILVLAFGAAPGFAHHKDGHEGGPQKDKGGSSTTVTEDNDDNDGGTPNNQVDEGDNEHPSGKDRSEEKGNSGNQGDSPSDPDGDSNGGPDKPGESGGVDLADQDGNNGCGNDDDFEDDNNGNCGGPKDKDDVKDAGSECPDSDAMDAGEGGCDSPDVEGETDTVCEDDATMSEGGECGKAGSAPLEGSPLAGGLDAGAEVLGEVITRGADGVAPSVANDTLAAGSAVDAAGRPATMPFTGADIMTILAAGLGLLATGFFILRFRRD